MTVNVTLQVDFTSQYPGDHRVCWRIQGSGDPYDCSNVITCLGNGNACTTSIPIELESNYCGPYTIEGYVQATCISSDSAAGRIGFTAVYNNTGDCISYKIECTSVSLEKIEISSYGSGFDPLDPAPTVTIDGNATGVAVIADTNDGIKTASINNPGSGYFSGGSGKALDITAVTAGPGINARFDVTVLAGEVVEIAVRNGGTLWSLIDQFSFNNADLGGTGAGFLGDVDSLTVIGEIKEVQLSFVGSGYTSIPTVTVDPLGFTDPPVVVAVLAKCPVLTEAMLGPNCDLTSRADTVQIPLNSTLTVCNGTPPPGGYPAGYTETQSGCCYDCTSYTVEALAGSPLNGWADVYYIDCFTLELTHFEIGGAAPGTNTFCAVTDSVLVIVNANPVTLTDNGDCIIT